MMPYHLGWCDEKVYEVTNYKTRTWYVKVTQKDKNPSDAAPKSKVFKVIQKGDYIMDQIRWSASTCYQWGRKDALLPGYNKFTGTGYGSTPPEQFYPTNKPWTTKKVNDITYNIVAAEGYLPTSFPISSIMEALLPIIFGM